eukprot:240126-Chlamydomonas_euryale.AAC.2
MMFVFAAFMESLYFEAPTSTIHPHTNADTNAHTCAAATSHTIVRPSRAELASSDASCGHHASPVAPRAWPTNSLSGPELLRRSHICSVALRSSSPATMSCVATSGFQASTDARLTLQRRGKVGGGTGGRLEADGGRECAADERMAGRRHDRVSSRHRCGPHAEAERQLEGGKRKEGRKILQKSCPVLGEGEGLPC